MFFGCLSNATKRFLNKPSEHYSFALLLSKFVFGENKVQIEHGNYVRRSDTEQIFASWIGIFQKWILIKTKNFFICNHVLWNLLFLLQLDKTRWGLVAHKTSVLQNKISNAGWIIKSEINLYIFIFSSSLMAPNEIYGCMSIKMVYDWFLVKKSRDRVSLFV